jgi:RNA polymerase sigma-70 factor (ECF subfamily)
MDQGATDGHLLEQAGRGNHAAFRQLVLRYESMVAVTVIGMLGAGDDADDVGQETFIRFHAALDQFRGEAALGTWLRRIAINLSLNALKRRRRASLRLVSRDQSATPLNEPPIEGHDAEGAERGAVVRAAIERLNPRHRSVVVLRMLEGLSTRETAEVLELPEGTVLSRLARAMVELERLLAPYMREESNDR